MPDAVVGDFDQRVGARQSLERIRIVTAIVGVLGRIGQHIADTLNQAGVVTVDVNLLEAGNDGDLVMLLPQQRLHGLERLSDDGSKLQGLALQIDPTLGDARNIQQIVDQP